jgi:hypothetical protein
VLKLDLDLFLTLRFELCFMDIELVKMRYLGYKFILVLLNLVVVCGSYCVVMNVHLNKGNSAEIYSFV